MTDDEINRRLTARPVADHLRGIGRAGLVERWNSFVTEVEEGYTLGLDDYFNDLDLREIIEAVGLGSDPDILAADLRLSAQLQDTDRRIWRSSYPDAYWIRGYPRKVTRSFLDALQFVHSPAGN